MDGPVWVQTAEPCQLGLFEKGPHLFLSQMRRLCVNQVLTSLRFDETPYEATGSVVYESSRGDGDPPREQGQTGRKAG